MKTRKGIKNTVNIRNNKTASPHCLTINDKMITDSTENTNNLNNYFSSTAKNLQEKNYPCNKMFNDYLINLNENSFFVNPTDIKKIESLLNEPKLQ